VYLSAPGYGIDGPCGDRPAFAPTIGAGTGLVMRNIGSSVPEHAGMSTSEVRVNAMRLAAAGTTEYAQADGLSAVTCASAMALGLLARDRTGIAQSMLTTMLTSTAHALADDMVEYAERPETPTADKDLYGYSALYRLYEASDGWIYLAAPQPREWGALVHSLADDEDLGDDQRFASPDQRQANDEVLAGVLAGIFKTKPAQHWEDHLLSHDVGCIVAVPEFPEDVLQDDTFGRAHGLVVEVEHPTFGEHPRLTPYVQFSRSGTIAEPGVLSGQHSDAILGELGYSDEAIADLRDRKVVA
jgi:crotonobetainyl-CoA:carnitine CoA-transferase CaiB-like acyl-CoA transferase